MKKSRSRSKKIIEPLFDLNYINKITKPFKKNLKTILKKVPKKGIAVFANKNILKDEVVCYYLVKAFDWKHFDSKYNNVYTMELYTKSDKVNQKMIGDICPESLQMPDDNGIAYWGYFANEPSKNQQSNTYIDINLEENYSFRNTLKDGDLVLYKLVASKDIKKGEEITWCYGSLYKRKYDTSCKN
jgi:hypothetical protein